MAVRLPSGGLPFVVSLSNHHKKRATASGPTTIVRHLRTARCARSLSPFDKLRTNGIRSVCVIPCARSGRCCSGDPELSSRTREGGGLVRDEDQYLVVAQDGPPDLSVDREAHAVGR